MTLEQFIEEHTKAMSDFVEMWKKGQEENPDHFPEKMGPGDWEEHLTMFCNS